MRRWWLLPLLAWVVGLALAHAAGFRMVIPWRYYQLLDAAHLDARPLASLCLLHSQPPGLNALLAATLAAAGMAAQPPERVAALLFAVLSAVQVLAVAHVARTLTGSSLLGGLAVVLLLADPGHHVFANLFFYEFLLAVLLALLQVTVMRYLRAGGGARLGAVAALVAAISATRSLFHPVWALGCCAVVAWLRARVTRERAASIGGYALPVLGLLAAGLALWPLKNAIVFGRPVGASMSAYSVARGVPGCGRDLPEQIPPGEMEEVVARAQRWCGVDGGEVLTAERKSDGSPNWNHVRRLVLAPRLVRCATRWFGEEPAAWLARAAGQYAMVMRPTFVQPYRGTTIGPPSAGYARYADVYRRTLFADLRPFVASWQPAWLGRAAVVRGSPVPYTLFGFVLFPALLLVVAGRCWRCRTVPEAGAMVALLNLLWPVIGACLTDGQEGNRMRVSTEGLLSVLAVLALAGGRPGRHRPAGESG